MQHKLLTSPESLAKILDLAEDAIISVDERQNIILFNRGAERMFGYSAQEAIGQPLDILLPAGVAKAHSGHIQSFAGLAVASRRMGERGRIAGRRKNGEEFPAEASISKVGVDGSVTFTAIVRDVSEQVVAEEKILNSLREKEVLLREIHHRVKNNLQVVASLLGLQARSAKNEQMHKMLVESQNRVHTMALLHENLYQGQNLSQVDFPAYIQQLAGHLLRSYGVRGGQIALETKLDQLPLNLDAALACGLIVNELVSNSLKYAFPNGRGGVVRIELREQTERRARLIVADDGAGLKTDFDLATAKTLGLRLVRTLAEQLGGTIEVRSDAGTRAQLDFPLGA